MYESSIPKIVAQQIAGRTKAISPGRSATFFLNTIRAKNTAAGAKQMICRCVAEIFVFSFHAQPNTRNEITIAGAIFFRVGFSPNVRRMSNQSNMAKSKTRSAITENRMK